MTNQQEISNEEGRRIMGEIAATGKFWNDWDNLKSVLSFHLNQVLSDYPEAKMTNELQISSLGEPFPDLAKRLDDALSSFLDGPPFTLQRLCEILLDARNIYPKLSKLALALEKNLLVTSTLAVSADPSATTLKEDEPDTVVEGSQHPSNSVPNGIAPTSQDPDEMMSEVEGTEVVDGMTIDMETLEEIVIPETNSSMPKPEPSGDS